MTPDHFAIGTEHSDRPHIVNKGEGGTPKKMVETGPREDILLKNWSGLCTFPRWKKVKQALQGFGNRENS